MAILKKLEIEVVVDGKPLTEYEDNDDEDRNSDTVVRYIESTTGSQFSLKACALESFKFTSEAVTFRVYLDGHNAATLMVEKDLIGFPSILEGVSQQTDQGWQVKPFIFSDIKYGRC